jgi:hypothetical protein
VPSQQSVDRPQDSAPILVAQGVTLPDSLPLMKSLTSGVYIVQNTENHNWAVISDTNDYSEVISGTNFGDKVGNKVESTLTYYEIC